MTFQEFESWFPDEHACHRYLCRLRWSQGFVCPRCKTPTPAWLTRRGLLHCPRCPAQSSVTAEHPATGHAQAAADVAADDLVRNPPEVGRQRPGPAARAGTGQLPDRLELAAQAQTDHGRTRPPVAGRSRRGRRDPGKRRGARRRSPASGKQSPGGHRRGGPGSSAGAHPAAVDPGRLGAQSAAFHPGLGGGRSRHPHRRLGAV